MANEITELFRFDGGNPDVVFNLNGEISSENMEYAWSFGGNKYSMSLSRFEREKKHQENIATAMKRER